MIKYSIRAAGKAAAGASQRSGWTGLSVGMPYIHTYVTADPTPLFPASVYLVRGRPGPQDTPWKIPRVLADMNIPQGGGSAPNMHIGQSMNTGRLIRRVSQGWPIAKPLSAPAVCTRWRNALSRLLSFRTRLSALAATTPRW
ncbi:hypothetical protein ARMGADRAFT_553457 [Armillaria gallica]|uniref:Uncharacterized protein n=1 Tax=Armillaria gallica TaxID=47427 RepID=A0A2H3D4M4_ARMGA|nr:hypothetical protein ARMGADRAFT_553457 [Armillaria gallica]